MTGGLMLALANPVSHITDKKLWGSADMGLPWFLSADGSLWWISNVTIMLLLGALVTTVLVLPPARRIAARRAAGGKSVDDYRAQGLWANLVEGVCLYLRDDVFRGVLGEETDRYTPMLWTLFWFILVCNLMGLIPILDLTAGLASILLGEHRMHELGFHGIGGTATQSIWVTGALALMSAIFYMGTAIRRDALGFLKHLTGGAPVLMWPIMVPVELMGYAIKPFALAIRLFANMTGGHLVIAVLLSFVPLVIALMGPLGGGAVSLGAMLGMLVINMLELLVAFIQAFIFTFLTCLFLGQLIVHEHEEHAQHAEHGGHAAAEAH